MYTDSVPDLELPEALDLAAEVGCRSVEIATGGQSSAPHLRIERLLESRHERDALVGACDRRGLRVGALNCSAWPLHPVVGNDHEQLIISTIRLAGLMDVDTVVTMSGTPGDGRDASTFNWVWYPWPDDALSLLDQQWRSAVRFWNEAAHVARDYGVRLAFELHPLHLAYNVHTLLRLREEVGPTIGANVDPSHLIWQGMDPAAVVDALGPAVHFVHLKDTEIVAERVALAGVLDQSSFASPSQRAWNFRAFGVAHDATYWARFRDALDRVRYVGPLSIENEDPSLPGASGVREAARFASSLFGLPGARLDPVRSGVDA